MPTSKPRITVTLTEEQHAVLRRISAAGGQSMSGVISEFMQMAQPVLERMAATVQQLKEDRDADQQMIARMLSELHAERERKAALALFRASPNVLPRTVEHSVPAAGTEPDAIQFCASVDFVREDSDGETGPLLKNIDLEARAVKRKRALDKSNGPDASVKGTLKRAKK